MFYFFQIAFCVEKLSIKNRITVKFELDMKNKMAAVPWERALENG